MRGTGKEANVAARLVFFISQELLIERIGTGALFFRRLFQPFPGCAPVLMPDIIQDAI